jgi:hypothetical protein
VSQGTKIRAGDYGFGDPVTVLRVGELARYSAIYLQVETGPLMLSPHLHIEETRWFFIKYMIKSVCIFRCYQIKLIL